jgi:hypothetical protein
MKNFEGKNRMLLRYGCLLALTVFCVNMSLCLAQSEQTNSSRKLARAAVPPFVRFNGILKNLDGSPHTSAAAATFSIFKEPQGGYPMWTETQNVQPDLMGRFTVFLGVKQPAGLPTNLFASGETIWIEVNSAGLQPSNRIALASVPYAFKAADAETFGGRPLTDFVLVNTKRSCFDPRKCPPPPNPVPVTTPGGLDGQVQFNQSGAFGGDASFLFDYKKKIIGVGPSVTTYLPFSSTPTTAPTLQIATGTPFFFQPGLQPVLGGGEGEYTGIGWSSTFTDFGPPYGAATRGMDVPLNIFKGYAPAIDPSPAYVLGANIRLQTDPAYTGNSSGSFLSPLTLNGNIQSPAHFGQVYGISMQLGSVLEDGQTVTIDDLRKIYIETLLGAGSGHTATYNVGRLVGLNLATQGFDGPQDGTITTSWAINIEGPRLGGGSGAIGTHSGIRMASQSQGNPGGRNPNAWAIHEDDETDRNALGRINLGGDTGPLISTGTGSPEGVVTSAVGGLYLRQDGAAGATLYVKESGSANTGWVAK